MVSPKMLNGLVSLFLKPLCMLMKELFLIYGSLQMLFLSLRSETNLNLLTIDQLHYRVVLKKIQERVVFKNMFNFLTENNLLYKYQSGFLPHHSTVFQLIDIFSL